MPQEQGVKIEEETRRQIAHFLPDAIAKTLQSYKDFYDSDAGFESAKEFSAHHSACKAAIAHVELLIKLAKWADLPDETGHREEDAELALLLANAEAELKKIQKD
ncbi:MAG: hypothetical protein CMH32_03145 [Micavibrio sp.]|nr:hypothetical protein [Micavibrio sp.]|tara:strand:+ start:610 stop:924 length:315 start_codon:yes stop_codon:yes gene_type:complete